MCQCIRTKGMSAYVKMRLLTVNMCSSSGLFQSGVDCLFACTFLISFTMTDASHDQPVPRDLCLGLFECITHGNIFAIAYLPKQSWSFLNTRKKTTWNRSGSKPLCHCNIFNDECIVINVSVPNVRVSLHIQIPTGMIHENCLSSLKWGSDMQTWYVCLVIVSECDAYDQRKEEKCHEQIINLCD